MADEKVSPEQEQDKNKSLKLPEDYPTVPDVKLERTDPMGLSEKEPRRTGIAPDQVYTPPNADNVPTTTLTQTAGVTPPDDNFFGGITKLYEQAAPLAVEIGIPVGTAIVASPLFVSPDPLTKVGYFSLLGASSSGANVLAQQMRIGYGNQKEFSWQENAAAGVFGLVPGIKSTKDMTKAGMIALRAGEAATMAVGETATRQGLEMVSGDRDSWDVNELFVAAGIGSLIGGGLGRLEKGLIKQSADETPQQALVRALKERIKDEKKTIKKLGDEKAAANINNLGKLESALEEVTTRREDLIVKKAIEQLTAEEERVTTQFKEAAQDILKANNGKPTAPRRPAKEQPTKTPEPVVPKEFKGFDITVGDTPNDQDFLRLGGKLTVMSPDEYINKVVDEFVKKEGSSREQVLKSREPVKDQAPYVFDQLENNNAKPLTIDTTKDYVEQEGLHRALAAKELGITEVPVIVDGSEFLKNLNKTPKASPKATATPEEAEQILNDFVGGKGKRDEIFDEDTGTTKLDDAGDPVKARLLTDDEELQQLINVVQDTISKQLEVGPVSKDEYMAKVAEAFESNLGPDEAATFKALMNASLDTTDKPISAQLEELGIRAAAVGTVLTHQLDRVRKAAQDTDWQSNTAARNDLMVGIMKTIPQFIEHKRIGSAEGRMLNARKYQNDIISAKYEEALGQAEEQLVEDLKLAKDMTPEELAQQVEKFGDAQAVRMLLNALKETSDTETAKKILLDQQQAFQNNASANRNIKVLGKGTVFNKVSRMGSDLTYASMLSAPITHMKALIGNAIMQRYLPFQGYIGAKYMATAPWARRGKTKEEWEAAAKFWKDTGLGYSNYNSLAFQEARRAFKSGDSDLVSKFERIGDSAFSMQQTGIQGALGQSVENLGQFVDLPGKSMAAIDMFSKQRVAHSMVYAHAYRKWQELANEGGDIPDFADFHKNMLNKIFTEDLKIKNEDMVRREAVLLADEQNIKADDLPQFIDDYVNTNWTTETQKFVDYVQRNIKEIAFQETIGEFNTAANRMENLVAGGEKLINENLNPIIQAVFFPFMRTGRNIIREGLSSGTAFLADTPFLQNQTKKMWAKTMQDLESDDPIVAARAKGRMVVSAGIITSIFALVKAGVITGREEQNWKKRENLETATGLGDYQVRIPVGNGKIVGVDYLALEPFATVAAIVADADTIFKNGSEKEKSMAMLFVNTTMITVANNISNKSYFKNIGTVIEILGNTSEETGTYAQRKLKSMGSAVVPSGMNALEYATDDVRRRSDTLLEVWKKRIAGVAQNVAPYRDAFGDAIPLHNNHEGEKSYVTQATSWLNPFKWKAQRANVENYVVTDKEGTRRFNQKVLSKVNMKDPEAVRNAAWSILIELDGEYHFNSGVTTIQTLHTEDGSIDVTFDMKELVNPETGQDAFDRWQEIYSTIEVDGLNVKQYIIELMKDRDLAKLGKMLPKKIAEGYNQEKTRLSKVNQLLSVFRKAAFIQLTEEYKESGNTFFQDYFEDAVRRREFELEGDTSEALKDPELSPVEQLLNQ